MHHDRIGQEGEPTGVGPCPARLQHRFGPCILPGEIRTQGIFGSSMEGVLEDHNHGDPHRRLDPTGRVVALGGGFRTGHLLLRRVPKHRPQRQHDGVCELAGSEEEHHTRISVGVYCREILFG
ncbi:hypothetical protein FH972_012823 [Carpinus fangiana]|uniref:Uncharacterized protein n=1 Tax=Carpinus fangiana TaxID=176857 RepID=A0A5N6R4V8_9ROSI|nr:hypothetical protein FH972_012823 [Carpinus fangiana]